MLLERQITIHGNKDVECRLCKSQQLSILYAGLAHTRDGLNGETVNVFREAAIYAFIE